MSRIRGVHAPIRIILLIVFVGRILDLDLSLWFLAPLSLPFVDPNGLRVWIDDPERTFAWPCDWAGNFEESGIEREVVSDTIL